MHTSLLQISHFAVYVYMCCIEPFYEKTIAKRPKPTSILV